MNHLAGAPDVSEYQGERVLQIHPGQCQHCREQVAVLLTQAGQQRHFHACDWSFAGYFPHRCPARQEAA